MRYYGNVVKNIHFRTALYFKDGECKKINNYSEIKGTYEREKNVQLCGVGQYSHQESDRKLIIDIRRDRKLIIDIRKVTEN